MPSNAKKRKTWCVVAMKNAYEAVTKGQMGYLKASKTFGVPKSTLEDYVKSDKDIDSNLNTKLGRKPTFSPLIEAELVGYCIDMVNRYYGLRASDIKTMAFQLAIKNNILHQFKGEKAGKKWLKGFMTRNPEISFRRPEATTAMRAKGFTQEKVTYFFDSVLQPELEKINYDATRIFNVDETGVTIVQQKMAKVICLKGQKQVGGISSAERGSLVTLVFCMSAAGMYVPPMFIFPRVNMKKELEDRAPPGSVFSTHKSGWIQLDIFTKWFAHFIAYVKPSREKPILLLLDGHFSHTRNLDIIKMARESGVSLVSIPPHTSHKLQPLDVGFMAPFKTYYAQQIETWLRANPGRVVTVYQISELVGKAYLRAATIETAVNSFKKCGICPFDKEVFRDNDFAVIPETLTTISQDPSSPTTLRTGDRASPSIFTQFPLMATPPRPSTSRIREIESPSTNTLRPPLKVKLPCALTSKTKEINLSAETQIPHVKSPQPSTSKDEPSHSGTKTARHSVSELLVSPQQIMPVPKILKTSNVSKRQTSATVLTSSPYKKQLEESVKRREEPKRPKKKLTAKKQAKKTTKPQKKKPKIKRKTRVISDSETEASSDLEMILDEEEDGEENTDDACCFYCNEAYSNDTQGERWIRCIACYKWCHELCAGVDDPNLIDFVCDICIEGD